MLHILKLAFRTLLKMRFSALVVLLTLAVGIAANLVVFALVNAALIRPLPFSEPDSLVALDDRVDGKSAGVSWAEVEDLERAPALFQSAAAYTKRTWGLTDHTNNGVDVILSGMVTPDFFRVLGPAAALGTTFTSDNEISTVVLSYALWQGRYHGDRKVIGRFLKLNDVPYQIVGVLPRTFDFPISGESPDLYIPLDRKDYCCRPDARGLSAIARLVPGVSLAAASQHLQVIAKSSNTPNNPQHFMYIALPLKVFLAQQERTLLFLWLAVTALGIIAALNAGAVLLARSLRNLRQYALKISLGATVRHLLAEQLAQAVILAASASALAAGLAGLGLKALQTTRIFQPLIGRLAHTGSLWDWRVFSFCVGLSLLAAICACLLPLAILRGMSPDQVLRSHSGLSTSRSGRRLRTTLIVAQLALSVTLFSAATTFGHALYSLLTRNPGFRTQDVVTAGIGVPEARYETDDKMIAFHQQVLESIRSIPGVHRAGFAAGAPLNPLRTRFLLDGSPNIPIPDRPRADIAFVSPDIFPILGLNLIRGRNFTAQDIHNKTFTAVVNRTFADTYLDTVKPLQTGFRISFTNGESMRPWTHFDIVGIVEDSRNRAIDLASEPEIYISTQQVALEGGGYLVETSRDAASLQTELPAAIWRVDPLIQKVEPIALQRHIESGFASQRLTLFLLLGFGAVALTLAATGLGAAISASVSESTKEIGIRTALGESRRSIAGRVLQTALTRTLVGTSCGIGGSIVLLRIASLRVGPQSSLDVTALVANVSLMLLIATVVSLLPVRRALRVSPVEALRAE